MQHVRAEIRPMIKLRKSVEDQKVEELEAAFGLVAIVGIIVGVLFLLSLVPDSALPTSSPNIAFAVFSVLRGWSFPLGVGAVVLVLLAIPFAQARRRADRSARARYAATVRALVQSAFEGAQTAIDRRRQREGMSLDRHIERNSFAPDPMRTGVTPRGAEELVAQWMRHLGEPRATVTAFRGDGGVDVAGERHIAQVKHFAANVGVAPIRELAGVAATDGRSPLFFTSTGYAPGAIEFADRAGVALFVYRAELGDLVGMNGRAKTLMIHGL